MVLPGLINFGLQTRVYFCERAGQTRFPWAACCPREKCLLQRRYIVGHLTKFRSINSVKTFGVELEIGPNSCPLGWDTGKYLPFFYKTDDISLDGGFFEYISEPMPYDMLVNKIKKLHIWVGGWRVNNSCGLHIHVSRQYWPEKRAKAFIDFLYKHGGYTSMVQWFGRRSHFAEPNSWEDNLDKYNAVNRLHSKTYEFRVWKAGDLEWTLEALRRTRAIVEHQGNWSVEVMDRICPQWNWAEAVPSAPAVPAVRRIRREPTLGDLLRQRINGV